MHGSDSRGQTTLDFAIGISLFLAVILFIFATIPGVIQPFAEGGENSLILSQRAGDKVAHDMLSSPNDPYTLNGNCTVLFFRQAAPGPTCRYVDGGDNVPQRLGLDPEANMNVTVEADIDDDGTSSRLCWHADDKQLYETTFDSDGDGDTECSDAAATALWDGDTPPQGNDQSVTTQRDVVLYEETVIVKVVVW